MQTGNRIMTTTFESYMQWHDNRIPGIVHYKYFIDAFVLVSHSFCGKSAVVCLKINKKFIIN